MNKLVKFPLILALTGTICATALGIVYQVANPIIEERVNKAANEAISEIVSGAVGKDITKNIDKEILKKYSVSTVYDITINDAPVCSGYKVTSSGFSAGLETLVLLDDSKIIGIKVLNHKETMSKFQTVLDANFTDNFANLPYDKIEGIDNISGATLSSKGIKNGVMQAVNAHKEIKEG